MADRKISALSELTAPVADDVIQIIDSSESSNSAKNKKIQYTTLLRNLPSGSNTTPSVGWLADSGATGLYRSAANTLSVSINQALVGSFQSSGFQLGAGTPAAQLHLFSTDTTDQVIIGCRQLVGHLHQELDCQPIKLALEKQHLYILFI